MAKEKLENNQSNNNPFPAMEEEVLNFWDKSKIFEKSVEQRDEKKSYVFYDGPPFATGTPHYGHIVASAMKDVIPRYWTMKGYRVERKWGWDCHGLPIENIAEKEMNIKNKKEIEELGVEKFNEICCSKVLSYVEEWEKVIRRLGRWADMKNAYKTMDLDFMESVWWVFKQLWDKGLIYEGYRSMSICPRCETTLSQQEIAEGYKMVKDLSATVKFELEDEPRTFILAWTTTPWTLIGNVALAVGENIDYVKISLKSKVESQKLVEHFILAKDRLVENFKDQEYEVISEFKGSELIGKKYKPLFDYYSGNEKLENRGNGWKIYGADFVTIEEGTGVVHIAPAFGEDDMNLGKENNLPFIQHVNMDGTIKSEAKDFAGMNVKPIVDTQKTDVEIIKYLAHSGLLFSKEKYEHSYPHCWRCETPLINYATTSWFVAVTKVKEKALEFAQKINWSPAHIKEGRFGNWLSGARDWSISRQRFWASVMPIWKCSCGEIKVVGSVDEIREQFDNPNKLFLIRHGEAENNVKNILNSDLDKNYYHLTEFGKNQIEKLADIIKKEKIDLIFASPFLRARETAGIIAKELKIEIIIDERLSEFRQGEFDGKTQEEFDVVFPTWPEETLREREEFGVETEDDARKRFCSFLEEINKKYKNKNIVIVSHGDPLQFIYSIIQEIDRVKAFRNNWYPLKGSFKILYSKKIDLHKHIVDKITFKCEKCGGVMKRIPDVLDTWFDSGSMPYAQMHYPFENKEKFENNFPAEFIAEGVDQTRAWFYYLHIIGTAIKNNNAFRNVIVNGIVLAEDGKKMAKRLNNYPDPMEIFNRYGADAMRYYLISSPIMVAENLNFSEKGVREALQKNIMILWNVYKFYELYGSELKVHKVHKVESNNILDKWIIARLNQLIREVTVNMDNYDLPEASRPISEFINDLSTWYLRRSRDRFKNEDVEDKQMALVTTNYVLSQLSRIIAPFMPFISEQIWQKVTGYNFNDENKSAHLEAWPQAESKIRNQELEILEKMRMVRKIVELGLAKRDEAGIKVRQMLNKLKVKSQKLKVSDEYQRLIKDEINIKEIELIDTGEQLEVELDINISDELRLEGIKREIVRQVNMMRKQAELTIKDKIKFYWQSESDLIAKIFNEFSEEIKKETLSVEIINNKNNLAEEKTKINNEEIILVIEKI